MTRVFCALGALALTLPALGQRLPPTTLRGLHEPGLWVRFGVEDGLPDARVLQIHETLERGAEPQVWAVTDRGAAWYDGHRWHAVGPDQGLPARRASDLAVDVDGNVLFVENGRAWLGSARKPFLPLAELDVAAGEEALACSSVPGGGLVVLVRKQGVPSKELRTICGPACEVATFVIPSADPRTLVRDAKGQGLWAVTNEGLVRRDAEGRWWPRILENGFGIGATALADASGRGLSYVEQPWQARGLYEWTAEGKLQHVEVMDFDGIAGLSIRPDGEAVVALTSGEVRVRHEDVWGVLDPLPREMRGVNDLRYRVDGQLWVATNEGLYLWRREHPYWQSSELGTSVRENLALEYCRGRDGTLWVGKAWGLDCRRANGQVTGFTNVFGRDLRGITALGEDNQGNIWVGSGTASVEGALRWDGQSFTHVGQEQGLDLVAIHKIRRDRSGDLWFLGLSDDPERVHGPQPGARRLLPDGRFEAWNEERGLPSGRVYDFLESADGSRWFATLRGLARCHQGVWTRWGLADGLRNQRVYTLAEGRDGRVWFGHESSGRGLGWVAPDDSIHYTSSEETASRAHVVTLASSTDGEGLWVGTDRGLFHYRGGSWTRFTAESGMQNDCVRALLVEEHAVQVGTHGGGTCRLTFPDPPTPTPVVVLSPPVVDGREALLRWRVHTWWGDQPAARVLTRHRLSGRRWSDWSTEREVVLSGLEYGSKHFEVQAKDYFGAHPPQGFGTDLRVLRPLHLHPLVLAPLLLVLLLSTGLTTLLLRRRARERAELTDKEERFRQLAENVHEVYWLTDWHTREVLYVSPAYEALTGAPVEELYLDARSWERHLHPEDCERAVEDFANLAATGEFDAEYRVQHVDGHERRIRARAFPVLDEKGQVYRVAGIAENVTAERVAAEALSQSQGRYRALVETIPDALVLVRGDEIAFANPAAADLFQFESSQALEGRSLNALLQPSDIPRVEDWLRALLDDRPRARLELRIIPLEDRETDVEWNGNVVELGGERAVQVVLRDVTERKRVEERQTLLMRELDHRVKNNLAGVLALAEQTMRGAEDLPSFEHSFTGRLRAMARTHEALAAARWEGVHFSELVSMVLSPYTAHDDQLSVDGPEIAIRARAVAPLGMALHELATNAAKYGALSKPKGHVRVSWSREKDGQLHVRWAEGGGGRVSPPGPGGLGLSIVRGIVEYELGGSSSFSFFDTGVQCDLRAPVGTVLEERGVKRA